MLSLSESGGQPVLVEAPNTNGAFFTSSFIFTMLELVHAVLSTV